MRKNFAEANNDESTAIRGHLQELPLISSMIEGTPEGFPDIGDDTSPVAQLPRSKREHPESPLAGERTQWRREGLPKRPRTCYLSAW
jgi:hypothetical protein